MPSLPFEAFDVLLVDYLGKNISGTGMDTNIIGRINIRGEADTKPDIRTICLFDLTPQSHGNGIGVGLADVIPQRLYDKINWRETYENGSQPGFCRGRSSRSSGPPTGMSLRRGSAPPLSDKDTLKLVRIRDTLHIDEIYTTNALLDKLRDKSHVEILERISRCDSMKTENWKNCAKGFMIP